MYIYRWSWRSQWRNYSGSPVEPNRLNKKIIIIKKDIVNVEVNPILQVIVQWHGRPSVPGVLSWQDLLAIGSRETGEALKSRLSIQAVNQCCTLIYTSGM